MNQAVSMIKCKIGKSRKFYYEQVYFLQNYQQNINDNSENKIIFMYIAYKKYK